MNHHKIESTKSLWDQIEISINPPALTSSLFLDGYCDFLQNEKTLIDYSFYTYDHCIKIFKVQDKVNVEKLKKSGWNDPEYKKFQERFDPNKNPIYELDKKNFISLHKNKKQSIGYGIIRKKRNSESKDPTPFIFEGEDDC